MIAKIDISVIVTVSDNIGDFGLIYKQISSVLEKRGKPFEIIFVEHADSRHAREKITTLRDRHPERISLMSLRSVFNESDALSAGFHQARGDIILVLPVYYQIDLAEIDRLFTPLQGDCDLVLARRIQRRDNLLNRIESSVFNWLVRVLMRVDVHDLGSGIIAMRKEVALALDMYGDMFRFIPVLAFRQGYSITETDLNHVCRTKKSGLYSPGIYVRRLLDIITLFFIIKFTKKPLRFFGVNGSVIFLAGSLINLYLVIYKFMGNPVADRPLLILGTLLMVLGIQLVSIGLIGELIIFVHARKLKEYHVEKIV